MAVSETDNNKNKKENETEPLIPGLPDEVAELCLLHLPYPYQALVRSVSSSWNRAIAEPSFLNAKKTLSRPYLFVSAFHKHTSKFQWQALDPSSNTWFVLPAMPIAVAAVTPSETIACASLPKQGKLFVLAGGSAMRETKTLVYRTTSNQWSPAAPAPSEPLFAAEGANGTVVTVEASSTGLGVEIYDPESDTWRAGARVGTEQTAAYEAVENDGRVYVTEGWRWPFTARPRGWVYETGDDTWREMGEGMRDGWTGVAVAVAGKVLSIAEYGDGDVKVYDEGSDTWRLVGGDKFPRDKLRRPFKAIGSQGRVYVTCLGLNVAIGTLVLCGDENPTLELKWQVVEAPQPFLHLKPFNCQVLYA